MSPITTIPALTGLLCGLSFFPMLTLWSRAKQRKAALKQEQQRLKNTTFILSGTIPDNLLINHMRSLCHLERQGVLHITTGRRKGYVLFRNGEIIDGFYRNSSGLAGFRTILKITEGDYYFESRQVLQPNLIRKKTVELLEDNS